MTPRWSTHASEDTFDHPLLVNRWRDQLTSALCPIAAGARSAVTELTPLSHRELRLSGGVGNCGPAAACCNAWSARQRLAALVRRQEESTRPTSSLTPAGAVEPGAYPTRQPGQQPARSPKPQHHKPKRGRQQADGPARKTEARARLGRI
ncbi:hypothetical protein GCM10010326_00240 [Streptomyces xanthochromogenes]|uniref:Uncharacterized protein n=1 Tax=Streptomyces xanthochromogenes TaxID=67384 RepID=A0ABQ2ZH25_9ACTN|nr:hypothetical protein GCM10010326_00240 [Streptomyces xanthochromogenes]